MLTHLRRNVVAYLALAVALSTGTAYAAEQLPKRSVGAPQLKKGAVTSKAVKNGSIKAQDLAAGVVPSATWVGSQHSGSGNVTAPAQPGLELTSYGFTVPHDGTLLLSWFVPTMYGSCPSGLPVIALYLDGAPVAGTADEVPSQSAERAVQLSGTVKVSAGAHRASVALGGCSSVGPAYTLRSNYDWAAVLTP